MKKLIFLFTFSILATVFFSGCSYVTRPAVSQDDITWEEVEAKYRDLEQKSDNAGIEKLSKEMMEIKWAKWQYDFIKFKLAESYFKKGEYEKSLEILRDLKGVKPFVNQTHLMAGEAALKLKKYDEALKWVLSVYLKLSKEEKIKGSKIVFLAYLYSKRIEKAATWYAALDEQKKMNIEPELQGWYKVDGKNRVEFENALANEAKIETDGIPEKMQDEVREEMKELEKTEEPAEEIPFREISYDGSYVPDWKNLCLALSKDEKWLKFNEVIKSFLLWYFNDFKKIGLNIEPIEFSDESDVEKLFEKAAEKKCFAVTGPFFTNEFVEDFKKHSLEKSIPVVSYLPYTSNLGPLFFNLMPTKDLEAENVIQYALKEKEKKRFAIAYVDDRDGREIRDIYWKQVEKAGGRVTALIDFAPGGSSFYNDVAEVIEKPDNFDEAIKIFRWKNKERFTTDVLMRRAIERFVKTIPGKCNFDALIVITPVNIMPLFLPSFPYMNVEFEYFQNYLNRNVAKRTIDIRNSGFEWDIQQILVLGPSEIVNTEKVVEQLGQLVDGMVVYAPSDDISEKNTLYKELSEEFVKKNERELYFIEKYLAETANLISSALKKSGSGSISTFVETLKKDEFLSILTGENVKFDDLNRMSGRNKIMIGRKKEPFMTPADIEAEIKRKEEEKKNRDKNKKISDQKEKPAKESE